MTRKNLIVILGIIGTITSLAQTPEVKLLSPEEFIANLKQYHPVVKQANLIVEKSKAMLLAARGQFDPLASYEVRHKTFSGKDYYSYINAGLEIPLPIGMIRTGVEQNRGDLLTSEATPGTSSYLGLEIPVLNGLLIDKRRAALQKAKIYREAAEQERLLLLNDILFDAYMAYWTWAAQYKLYNVYERFNKFALERLRLVKISYFNGDRSPMDTTEAYTQWQSYLVMQAEAAVSLNKSIFALSDFLWTENDSNYLLPPSLIPDTVSFINRVIPAELEYFVANRMLESPLLRYYDFKLADMEVERRLKFQQLLPYVALKGNILSRDYYNYNGFSKGFIPANNQWGLTIQMPLFFREARGNYRAVKLKIRETELERTNKQAQAINKIYSLFNETELLKQQVSLNRNIYQNYASLLRNEELRFRQGESSLFVINARENKIIETLQKEIEIRLKYFKARYSLDWVSGRLE